MEISELDLDRLLIPTVDAEVDAFASFSTAVLRTLREHPKPTNDEDGHFGRSFSKPRGLDFRSIKGPESIWGF